jgi:molybdopterin-guanine dinucleotide biosynthesis protein A
LKAWQASIDVVAQNLTDLRTLPVYQRLSGAPGYEKARLAGETAEKVDAALDLMCQLFEHLDRLYLILNDAKHVRRDLPSIFGAEERMREIDRLLNTASIDLPPITTPVAARGLLSIPVTERKIRPHDLLAGMMQAYAQAKSIVIEIDDAWRGLDMTITRAELEIVDFKQKLTPPPQELLGAEARIRQIRKEIDQDPLNAKNVYSTAIEPLLNRLRKEFEEAVRVQNQARQGLDEARERLRNLVETNARAIAAGTESTMKVAPGDLVLKTPVDPATIEALQNWLQTLAAKITEGMGKAVLIGLERWNAQAATAMRTAELASAANQAPALERRELRGRLQALKAKAQALGLSEQTELSVLAARASKLLYDTPTPLGEARDLVRQFERSLNHGR